MALTNYVDQDIILWLNCEPFTVGSLQTPPHSRLTVNNIKKIVSYAKTKGKAGFPNLTYAVWSHIACNKLQLTEELAWIYFVAFDLSNDACSTPESHLEFDRKAAAESTRNQLSAPTLRFILFLYLQHIHKISLRASLVSGSDEWPTRARSPDLDGRSAAASGKALDENAHLTFVLNNLDVILDLLTEPAPDSRSPSVNSVDLKDLRLSVDAVEALDYLISGSVDENRTIRSLRDIALLPSLLQQTGYSKTTRSFSFRSLQTWLRSHLTYNPFGVNSCVAHGRHVSWLLKGEKKDQMNERRRGRIVTNAVMVPKDNISRNKLIVMSQVSQQTVARSSTTLEGSTVKIHRCVGAFIYLLSPLRAVSIDKCQDCSIVLGPIELSLDIVRCDNVTVIGVTRRFSTIGSKSCQFYLMTPNYPLIYGGNENLVFAPYHTHYPLLEEHMEQVGLQPQPNFWDQPQYIGTDHTEVDVWKLLNPSEFYEFTIPFDLQGDTKRTPGGLPARYQKALEHRNRSVAMWQGIVREAGLTKEQKGTFMDVIDNRFQEWLKASGHIRQLDGLAVSEVPP